MLKKILSLFSTVIIILSSFSTSFADEAYTVKSGDVLWKIAETHNVQWKELVKINQLKNPNLIYPGQVLSITSKINEFISEKIMIKSRGIDIPAVFTYPVIQEGKKYPVVIMAHGHGGDKDTLGGFVGVAENLGVNGIASIRIDFPGCGESSEPFTSNNLTNMLEDINSSLTYVIEKPMIDKDKVGILGYSMGGRLALLEAGSNPIYKTVLLWSPAGTNGVTSMLNFLGAQDEYSKMSNEANEKGSVLFTTRWGQHQELSKKWFEDMAKTKPLEGIKSYTGSMMVVYGDKDDVIYPDIDKAVIEAATNCSIVKEYVVEGGDHSFGLYNNDKSIAEKTINVTVEFLKEQLK